MKFAKLSVLLLFITFSFQAQAQKSTSEDKATQQAKTITKFINSKLTEESDHLSAAQTSSIKGAYLDYFNDMDAYKNRKKEFMTTYKTWKAAATAGEVSAEEKAKLEAQKKEIALEQKALNKESKDMKVRREDKIKEVLNDTQTPIFEAMRAEQSSKDEKGSDK